MSGLRAVGARRAGGLGGLRLPATCVSLAALVLASFAWLAGLAHADVDMHGALATNPTPLRGPVGEVKPFTIVAASGKHKCLDKESVVASQPYWLAIGNCPKGAELDVASYMESEDTQTKEHSYGGWITGAFEGCGWIDTRYPFEARSGTTTHCQGGVIIAEASYREKVNPSPIYHDGSYVVNPRPCPEYANYRPWSANSLEKEKIGEEPAYAASQVGSTNPALKWRYTTLHNSTDGTGQYVMVRDEVTTRKETAEKVYGQGNWVFVPLSCLVTNPAELPETEEGESMPPPVATTGGTAGVTPTQATLKGTVATYGMSTNYYFIYGTTTKYEEATITRTIGAGPGTTRPEVETPTKTLKPNTTYHFKIVAFGPTGSGEGVDQTFATPPPPPTVTTGAATEGQPLRATLNGTVNPNGFTVTDCHFDYGTSTAYGSTVGCTPTPGAGTSPVAESATVSLTPGTVYHFRLVATNAGGASSGIDETFKTPGPVEAETSEASNVLEVEATLNGTVNPRGYDAKYHFQYGETTSYGSATAEADAGAGEGQVTKSISVKGLEPNTTYHYRMVATSGGVTSTGHDHDLKTGGQQTSSSHSVRSANATEVAAQGPGNSVDFYEKADGQTGWTATQVAGAGSAYSTPAIVRGATWTDVAVQGPNHTLNYWYSPDGSGKWYPFSVPGENIAYSAPTLVRGVTAGGSWTDIAVEGPNNTLNYWYTPDGSGQWYAFPVPGASIAYSAPALVRGANAQGAWTDIAVRGPNNTLNYWYKPDTSGEWYAFTVPGANVAYSAPVLQRAATSTDIAVQGPNNTLNYWYTPDGSGQWYSFPVPGGNTAYSAPTLVRGVNTSGRWTDIAVQGTNNTLNYWYTPDGSGQWYAFPVPGSETAYGAPSLTKGSSATSVAVEGPNHTLNFSSTADGSGTWNSGPVPSRWYSIYSAGASVRAGNATEIAAQGPGNTVDFYEKVDGQTGWTATQVAGPGTAYSTPAIVRGATWTDIAVQGPNHTLSYWYSPDGSGQWYSFAVPGENVAYSAPTLIRGSNAQGSWTDVAVQGPNNTLNYWYTPDGSGQWYSFPVPGGNDAYSAPVLERGTNAQGSWTDVAVQGPNNTLNYWYTPDGSGQWYAFPVPGSNIAYSAPTLVRGATWTDVAVQGPNNTLNYWYTPDGSGQWYSFPVPGSNTAYSAPTLVRGTNAQGSWTDVAVQGPNNTLNYWYTPDGSGQWYSFPVPGGNIAYSAPTLVRGPTWTGLAAQGPNNMLSYSSTADGGGPWIEG
jgi:ligand-binding SRPBCC domain-containing protein